MRSLLLVVAVLVAVALAVVLALRPGDRAMVETVFAELDSALRSRDAAGVVELAGPDYDFAGHWGETLRGLSGGVEVLGPDRSAVQRVQVRALLQGALARPGGEPPRLHVEVLEVDGAEGRVRARVLLRLASGWRGLTLVPSRGGETVGFEFTRHGWLFPALRVARHDSVVVRR